MAYLVKCERCGKLVQKIKLKSYAGRTVTALCERYQVDILLDKNSNRSYCYNGKTVKGREVSDGLRAYPVHVCGLR